MLKPRWRTFGISFLLATCSCALAGFLSFPLQAQSVVSLPSRMAETAASRAEQEAQRKVSLSADKIIQILRNEPGLLLEVKKMLVTNAYEQGRILDAADLTDDALFRLLWEDDNIRVLATREIEDRYYVRAKPTREELERQMILGKEPGISRTSAPNVPSGHGARNQEEAYWDKHERDWENYVLPQPERPDQPSGPAPVPPNPAPQNPARAVERTGLQQNNGEPFDSISPDASRMARIRPEELPDLLNVDSRATSAVRNGGGPGNFLLNGLEQPLPFGASRPPIQAPGSSMNFPSRLPETSQHARLENPRPPVPSPSDLDQDRPQIRHRPNPYANVPSLYDLYAQVSRRPPVLERFGMDIFRSGTGNLNDLPMDLPAGADYVLGPGDGLSIDLWGGVAQRLQRVVDREGRVALPEVGTVQVSGRSLGEVQRVVRSALRTQFRDVEADVSLARIRSVRVYVVGDVASPGAYDISSLSTPLNALYAASGPSSRGSLRHLRHLRGNQLLEEIDAYDLLLHGIHGELARIQSGDTILVPPIGPEVTVEGMVRRPAIYELAGEETLAELLELAGGVLPSGTLRHVDVERVVAHEKRTMLRLELSENNNQQAVNQALEEFPVQDGDKVKIWPILPYADQTVYLDGHVFRPGKYPYREGMKVTDIVHSYADLLPEPSQRHAEIIRLEGPDHTPVVLAFNLGDALEGKDHNLILKPFDTVRSLIRIGSRTLACLKNNWAVLAEEFRPHLP